jgi:hypothetical protein
MSVQQYADARTAVIGDILARAQGGGAPQHATPCSSAGRPCEGSSEVPIRAHMCGLVPPGALAGVLRAGPGSRPWSSAADGCCVRCSADPPGPKRDRTGSRPCAGDAKTASNGR